MVMIKIRRRMVRMEKMEMIIKIWLNNNKNNRNNYKERILAWI